MNKLIIIGAFFVIFFAGLFVIFVSHSISISDVMRSLGNLSPRILSVLALPFVAAIFWFAVYLHKKSQDRMWKRALKDTRDRRQH